MLEGRYVERGSSGRYNVEAGQIVAHGMFESHDNEVVRTNTRVLNLSFHPTANLPPVFRVEDVDELIAAARSNSPEVTKLLRPIGAVQPCQEDWPDELARVLRTRPVRISDWADEVGLAAATVTRGFSAAFGTTPSSYRLEALAIRAIGNIVSSSEPFAQIAADCGFADQAHLCRTIKELTGQKPGYWRIKSIQDAHRSSS